uniref:Uncharacterized protein n=1 Tax=Plectus sambesii TaxID=2011161 RepID=A0A914UNI4_9BILA
MGVWNDKPLQAGTTFGPYRGQRQTSHEQADQSGYSWEVETKFGDVWVDGKDERFGNWMRFVNHGFDDEPHLFAFEWKEDIFYVVRRFVPIGTELLVSYGTDYGYTLQPFNKAKRYIQAVKRSSVNGAYPCDKCESRLTFSSAELLEAHTERYHSERHQFECPHCDKKFTEAGSRNNHVLIVHEEGLEKKHKCSWCQKAFNQRSGLNRHRRTHTKEKPFKCSDCGVAFGNNCDLIRHKRIHSAEDPFACTLCAQTFNQSGDLHKHVRIHTGEKPYKCRYCEKRFAESSNCRKHERRLHR